MYAKHDCLTLIHFLIYSPRFALRKKCPYSVRMRENTDQKNSEYRHFSRSVELHYRCITSSGPKNLWMPDASRG